MVSKSWSRSVDLSNSINKTIVSNKLIQQAERILIAISGGQDSVCLLTLLNQYCAQMSMHLGLVWCNHLWQLDSFSVMEQISKISFVFQLNSCFLISERPVPSELLARNWRHHSSCRICLFYNYDKIGLAHSANDKVETILFNLVRGTGIAGLSPLKLKSPILMAKEGAHLSKRLNYPRLFFSPLPRWVDPLILSTTEASSSLVVRDLEISCLKSKAANRCTTADNKQLTLPLGGSSSNLDCLLRKHLTTYRLSLFHVASTWSLKGLQIDLLEGCQTIKTLRYGRGANESRAPIGRRQGNPATGLATNRSLAKPSASHGTCARWAKAFLYQPSKLDKRTETGFYSLTLPDCFLRSRRPFTIQVTGLCPPCQAHEEGKEQVLNSAKCPPTPSPNLGPAMKECSTGRPWTRMCTSIKVNAPKRTNVLGTWGKRSKNVEQTPEKCQRRGQTGLGCPQTSFFATFLLYSCTQPPCKMADISCLAVKNESVTLLKDSWALERVLLERSATFLFANQINPRSTPGKTGFFSVNLKRVSNSLEHPLGFASQDGLESLDRAKKSTNSWQGEDGTFFQLVSYTFLKSCFPAFEHIFGGTWSQKNISSLATHCTNGSCSFCQWTNRKRPLAKRTRIPFEHLSRLPMQLKRHCICAANRNKLQSKGTRMTLTAASPTDTGGSSFKENAPVSYAALPIESVYKELRIKIPQETIWLRLT